MTDITKDFSLAELRCPCPRCTSSTMVPAMGIMLPLQAIRDEYGSPIKVTCGVRCELHNAELGGASDSRHLLVHADAVDIECTDSTARYRLLGLAIKHGIRFIEVCPNHLHFDMRPTVYKMIVGADH